MDTEIKYIPTENCIKPDAGCEILEARRIAAENQAKLYPVEVTVLVLAYNRLEKTKRCLESITANCAGIDYELLLVDNGSDDGTFEYFKAFPFEKKRIVRVTKGVGTNFPFSFLEPDRIGRYLAIVNNDLVITPNWLQNLMRCAKSDPRIGMINPISSNASNFQGAQLHFTSYEDMQAKAKSHNVSDPKQWEERLRLVTLGTLYTKEALLAVGMPLFDCGFFHDFSDDDISVRIRRAGYKLMLAEDTWIHHDHNIAEGDNKDPAAYRESLEHGRMNFKQKYFGVDAMDDINNYYRDVIPHIKSKGAQGIVKILGIDVKCGTPILEIKNRVRKFGMFEAELSAFTQDAKYQADLNTICNGIVACDREEFIRDYFPDDYYDYIILGNDINRYHEPQKMIDDLFRFAGHNGTVILPLLNTYSLETYLNILGQRDVYNPEFAYHISAEALQSALEAKGNIQFVVPRKKVLSNDNSAALREMLAPNLSGKQLEDGIERLLIDEFIFGVEKI